MNRNRRSDYDPYDRNYNRRDDHMDQDYGSSRGYREGISGSRDSYRDRYDDTGSVYGDREYNMGRGSSGITVGSNVVTLGRRHIYGMDNDRGVFEGMGNRMGNTWNEWRGSDHDYNRSSSRNIGAIEDYGTQNVHRDQGPGGMTGDYGYRHPERNVYDRERGYTGDYGAGHDRDRSGDYRSDYNRGGYRDTDHDRIFDRSDYDRRG